MCWWWQGGALHGHFKENTAPPKKVESEGGALIAASDCQRGAFVLSFLPQPLLLESGML